VSGALFGRPSSTSFHEALIKRVTLVELGLPKRLRSGRTTPRESQALKERYKFVPYAALFRVWRRSIPGALPRFAPLLEFPECPDVGTIHSRQRLGGLLRYYYREAAFGDGVSQ